MIIKHISTLVSVGRNPVSDEPRHSQNDSLAMNVAINLAKDLSTEHRVLHVGDPNSKALTEYFALGAEQIDVIPLAADINIIDYLADELEVSDLILTGSRAESNQDSGLVPYLLAAKLSRPLVTNALSIKLTQNGLQVLQFLPKGKRRTVTVKLPAIVVIHPLAQVQLRYAYAQQITGVIKPSPFNQLTITVNHTPKLLSPARKPIKLKAHENKSGHERMMSAISSESKGGAVVNNGNSVEKAQVILRYLREHHLINF